MSQHQFTTTPTQRVEAALAAVRAGKGVLVVDDEDRENEGDIIFSAEKLTRDQMAMLIRECSGIVCLCLPEERVKALELPMMVANNTNRNRTAFTIPLRPPKALQPGFRLLTGLRPFVRPLRRMPGLPICTIRDTSSLSRPDPEGFLNVEGILRPAWTLCALLGFSLMACCAS